MTRTTQSDVWTMILLSSVLLLVCTVTASPASAGAAGEDPLFERWETIGVAEGLPSDKVFAVVVDGPRVWAGTDSGLALLEHGTVRVFGAAEGLPFPAVTALAISPTTGDLWIGTMGGLACLSGGKIQTFTQLDSGLANNVIYGIATDGADVWVATAAGLSRLSTMTGDWEIFDTSNTLMHEPWTYAVSAQEGTVYVAVWGGGVVIRDAGTGKFRQHRDPDGEMEIDLFRDDGLVHDVTSAIGVSGKLMWVGTYFGLSRYDGRRWKSYNQEDSGLAGDFINFVRARGDQVWIATDQGLSRFDSETWHTWRRAQDGGPFELQITGANGVTRKLKTTYGLESNTIYGVDLAHDGIWLATAAGLTHGIARRGNVQVSLERPEPGEQP